MNYIYDIVLNFQVNYYQFFEWNRTDKIKNVKKIPVYRVKDEDILAFSTNQIIIEGDILKELQEKNKRHKKIMFLVSNTKQTIGLLFTSDGTLLKRSSLLFEEETEVNDFSKELPLTKITYKKNIPITRKNNIRIEIEKKDILVQYIKQTNDITILKYLYYEYFKEECTKLTIIKQKLLKILEEDWNINKTNLYHLIELLTNKNLVIK